jgi:hypothetical protein
MRQTTRLTRRALLRLGALLGAGGVHHLAAARTVLEGVPGSDALAVKLTQVYRHSESAKRVGLAGLRCGAVESDIALLVHRICSGQSVAHEELAHTATPELRELLARQIRDDFAHDRIVNLEGWILAETEVRLCALAALI